MRPSGRCDGDDAEPPLRGPWKGVWGEGSFATRHLSEHNPMPGGSLLKMVSKAAVAGHLDISTTALRGLIEAKVDDDAEPGKLDLDAARVSYIRHLRAGAAGRGGDSLSRERARLAGEQAVRAARENKLASAQVIERADVLAIMTAGFSAARSRLLGIPTRAAPLLVGLSVNEVRAKLVEEVECALEDLANAKVTFEHKRKR